MGVVIVASIAAIIIGGTGGFLVGYQIGTTSDADDSAQQAGMNGMPGGMMGGQFTRGGVGTVSAVSSDSITIKNRRQGDETTYSITSDTTVTDNDESATISDVKVGDLVMIQSDDDTDADTKTATSVELNPSFGGGPNAQTQSSSNNNTSVESNI